MKVLITGGPTWVRIDEVRIVTNIFTGKTALYLAKGFRKKGCSVTLLINPHCINKFPKNIRILPFRYFDELKAKLERELKKLRFDVIIHNAAVSDYKVSRVYKDKVSSGKKQWVLRLVPCPKLIKTIRRLAKRSYLVQFKLEAQKRNLIDRAFASLRENRADLVVANSLEDLKLGYKAYIIDRDKNIIRVSSKRQLFYYLFKILSQSCA
jgi:phosphopantothenoylcysteine synthetase/decarboxylase